MTIRFAKSALSALVLAAGFAASAQASTAGFTPAQSLGPRPVTYCGACLCTSNPPAMTVAGDWVPNGQVLGGSTVLKFRPAGQAVSAPTACHGAN
jgi:hypothetical protein